MDRGMPPIIVSPSGHTDAPGTSRTVVYTSKIDKCVISDAEMTDIDLEID